MSEIERRAIIKGAAISALAFTVGGKQVLLSPRQAHAENIPLRTLTPEQGEILEALGETLVPGAQAAGIANFVDQQLSIPPEEALLEARILNIRPPYANFYRAALGAIDRASLANNDKRGFARISESERREFVDQMRQNKVAGWQGPPGPFVYLVMRSDAVDVVYGTMDGYAALGVPYMAHIAPTKRW
ncbi:MAG TPA: gluconate 2-dehydrogenase subunit 3 family protein [Rhizomicrobium sp.]|nr:gluconate 2-dehydrogenase subunit 3 family protein [Rhizomicrobium sp.]